ncbi:CHAT domain-containing protein [Alloacidobacterium dinghuense]|uniref:CHAT domain-containing protein n=1 Tax=Alloacidobacterium dinghuense TaxID=2763107 RepID=A0A7G8BK83_9BACT|nr:CHAT domain-containing tetratricopeptide repeat protein [Alloacidobacterium dinghuense]QNI32953.1 CHAT domain-containing protein [Alloacidobacterium dinghuense]
MEKLAIQGDLDKAHEEAIRATAGLQDQNPDWAWKFRLLDAAILVREGKGKEVISLLSGDLPTHLAISDIALERILLQARVYASLGQDHEARVALNKADTLLNSLKASSDLNRSPLISRILNSWGFVDIQRGNLGHAEEMFRQSLDFARKQNDTYQQTVTLLNLGWLALQRERFDEALDWSDDASKTAQSINARSILEKAQGNVAWADYMLGNFEQALAGFGKAEQEAVSIGEAHDRMLWLENMGLSLYRLGHLTDAETNYSNSLHIADTVQDAEIQAAAHIALAELFLQLNNLDLSIEHTEKALSIARASGRTSDAMDATFLKGLIAERQQKPADSVSILMNLNKDPAIKPSLQWQVEGALANLYAEANNSAMADSWYRSSITTFETQRKTITKEESKLPFSTHADQLYDDYIRFLVNHNKTDEALQWLDLGRARTLEEGLGVASPDFNLAIKKSLDVRGTARRLHGTILVYTLAAQESYLWAVNSSGTHFFKLPPQEEIDAHVKKYQRAILGSRDPLTDAYVDGMALYRILVEPAASLIPKGSPVFIIPDGSISTLNFETLLAPGGGIHYWIEDATITNVSSLKLLDSFHPERHAHNQKELLLIGNPVSPDQKFPDLPNASAEVSNVARHFPSTEESVIVQKQALPSAYADSSPGEYSLIHFVAHGTSSSASPLDSAIVLTRNPANPDSFKLYARDVIQHPLHADLVAISACYGSGSRIYGGEGLVGLSWAFLRAGSHYVIGSLWEVSDSAAPEIMDHMYGEIAGGRRPDAALRDAKLAMLHTQNVFRKPLYWATFQLYGGA